jgi:hypothetical protein
VILKNIETSISDSQEKRKHPLAEPTPYRPDYILQSPSIKTVQDKTILQHFSPSMLVVSSSGGSTYAGSPVPPTESASRYPSPCLIPATKIMPKFYRQFIEQLGKSKQSSRRLLRIDYLGSGEDLDGINVLDVECGCPGRCNTAGWRAGPIRRGGGAGRRAAHSGGTAQARGRRTAGGPRRQEGGAQRRDGVDRRAAHGDGGGAARTAVAARS